MALRIVGLSIPQYCAQNQMLRSDSEEQQHFTLFARDAIALRFSRLHREDAVRALALVDGFLSQCFLQQ